MYVSSSRQLRPCGQDWNSAQPSCPRNQPQKSIERTRSETYSSTWWRPRGRGATGVGIESWLREGSKDAATALDRAGVIVNKNAIPFDKASPFVTSGIRVGSPAATTRGMKEPEMKVLAAIIMDVLRHLDDESVLTKNRLTVKELAASFPVP